MASSSLSVFTVLRGYFRHKSGVFSVHPCFLSLTQPVPHCTFKCLTCHVTSPASYLRPTPLCDRHLPASHVIILCFFSLSLSLSLSPAATHLSRVMRQLRFSLAHPWVNSNMAYWLTPECAHEAENTDEKVFFFFFFCALLSHK